MQVTVMNKEFRKIAIVDSFASLIWTDRYDLCGDFELYIPVQTVKASEGLTQILSNRDENALVPGSSLSFLKQEYYIQSQESDRTMIIESINIEKDIEEGMYATIKGRSLESLLDRRIVWNQTVINGSLVNGVKKLLNDSIISPSDASRKISNFIFQEPTDESIKALTLNVQYTGDKVYEAICDICRDVGIGFKVVLNESDQFVFSLYKGIDSSYDQIVNPYVSFSPKLDNLLSSTYNSDLTNYGTVTLVAGEGEGSSRRTYSVSGSDGAGSGIERREIFTDARDISSDVNGSKLSNGDYNNLLKKRGETKLTEAAKTTQVGGQARTDGMYLYGKDYSIGDIVQIANDYGQSLKTRVTEYTWSYSDSATDAYPTFETINEKGIIEK